MEKRTILAFALCFLILIMWSFFFGSKQEQVPPKVEGPPGKKIETRTEPAEKRVVELPPPSAGEQKRKEELLAEDMAKEILVETPLYRIIFSTAGAEIKSCKLKKYRLTTDPDSPPVEIVNLMDIEKDFLSFSFDRGLPSDSDKFIYHVNEDYIRLAPGSAPRDLTFDITGPDGVSYNQTYRFYPDRYDIDLTMNVTNRSESEVGGKVRASLNNRPPEKKSSYYSFVGIALLINDELEQIKPKKMKEEKNLSGQISWMAYENDYFMSAILPENQQEGNFSGRFLPSGVVAADYSVPPVTIRPLERVSYRFIVFIGPQDRDTLKKTGHGLDRAINFGFFNVIAKPLHYALRFFNQYVHNYGISIIILTILIKILFWPLTHKSYKSMKEMQKLQPIMAKIREKYKNNKEQMQKELMGLYKTYKVNPMGGCLPMIIQIPVFFALFRILGTSIELRHAPFMLWINDLSAPDRLFHFPFSIPFMSPPYGIPVLTLFMGASMFIQQKMTPSPGDPSQAKVMMFLPIIFTVMFINFPSGLVLYWLTNNILSIAQQYRIKKRPG